MFDAVTDFNCDYISWKEGLLHGGFYTCAQWVLTNVIQKSTLQFMSVYNTKKLVVCGHSMGAGVSAILGLLLNDAWETSKLHSLDPLDTVFYCYGSPAIISEHLINRSQAFNNIFTFNYGNDLTSHLSYGSMKDFCSLIMVAAKHVTRSFFYYLKEDSPAFKEAMEELHATDISLRGTENPSNKLSPDASSNIKLLSAGIYYHMILSEHLPSNVQFSSKTKEFTKLSSEITIDKHYKITLLERSDGLFYCHMLVATNAIAHHFPIRYELGLDRSIHTLALIEKDV